VTLRPAGRALVVALAAAIAASACASDPKRTGAPAATRAAPHSVIVFGSGVTVGDRLDDAIRDAWPRLVFDESFPLGSILVNAAMRHATFATALTDQLPLAASTRPDTALIWLGLNDVYAGETPATVAAGATALVTALERSGTRRVLIANLPTVDGGRSVAATNLALGRAAARDGAVTVDLSALHVTADDSGDVVPTKALHRRVADAFERALRG